MVLNTQANCLGQHPASWQEEDRVGPVFSVLPTLKSVFLGWAGTETFLTWEKAGSAF